MTEITELLHQAADGTGGSLDEIFSRLHGELRILARSRVRVASNSTMTATALVHELYLKFVGSEKLELVSRQHFFACAGAAMRQIMVDAARASAAGKRGGDVQFITLTDANLGDADTDAEMLALDLVLRDLELVEPDLMELVQLRFFAGLSMDDIAELTGRSVRSLHRDWSCARAFLSARLAA